MNYPLISEYVEAIRLAEDNFDQLKHLRPVLADDGRPVMSSGNFAVVFKMRDEQTGHFHAVKCFLKEQEGRDEAYRQIADELEFVSSTFLTPIRYLEKELFVDTANGTDTEFPVLLMDWVEGTTLDKYVREHIGDPYALALLAYQFSRLSLWLLPQPFAHGDLKPDNILVKADGTLVLVDYDGMYVPAMRGMKARELGSPDFRHPSRTDAVFDEHIDDFPLASILLSLKAIALQPELLEKYGAADRLLFSERDYRDIGQCALLKELYPSEDAELNILMCLFTLAQERTNLTDVSYRLFNLNRPKFIERKPAVQNVNLSKFQEKEAEPEILSTEVTQEDWANAWVDEYGVKYSQDRKRLLIAPKNIKSYSIKDGTKAICNNAFSRCENLTAIHIPNSVTAIGDEAFGYCENLTEIHIPNSVTAIGDEAFCGCEKLTEIHIPNSVTSIGNCAFCGCKRLTEIHIPNSVTTIGKGAFYGCEGLTAIHIPNGVTAIGDHAFWYCKGLTAIHIPDSVTSIGENTFRGCSGLTAIHIPNGVTTIGERAFWECSGLTEIHIPNGVTAIGNYAFGSCFGLTGIHIPNSVTAIGEGAFCSSGLTEIHIPNSVITIGDYAFSKCI